MAPTVLHVPAIRYDADGEPVVTRWGRVGAFTFRAGDRLHLSDVQPGALALLCPAGFGWPMLGRCTDRGLIAEPGAVPASSARWSAVGGVAAVARPLDRCVVDPGRWWVAGGGPGAARAGLAGPPQELDGDAVDALCDQLAARCDEVALGVASAPLRAGLLAASARLGTAWIDPDRPAQVQPLAELVEGPWPGVGLTWAGGGPRHVGVQLELFRARRFGVAG